MDEPLETCPACGCRDLFIRKDFPQKLGLALVIVGAISFLILAAWAQTFYLGVMVLLGFTIIDALIYMLVGKVTVCYRCRAEYRNKKLNADHHPFDLATGEKYRTPPTSN